MFRLWPVLLMAAPFVVAAIKPHQAVMGAAGAVVYVLSLATAPWVVGPACHPMGEQNSRAKSGPRVTHVRNSGSPKSFRHFGDFRLEVGVALIATAVTSLL